MNALTTALDASSDLDNPRSELSSASNSPGSALTECPDHPNATTTVIIIGAGITGIGAAYYLAINNVSYTILEAKDDLGGVWYTHRWHGARCDSEFIKYSYSFKTLLSPYRLQTRDQIHEFFDFAHQTGLRVYECVLSKASLEEAFLRILQEGADDDQTPLDQY